MRARYGAGGNYALASDAFHTAADDSEVTCYTLFATLPRTRAANSYVDPRGGSVRLKVGALTAPAFVALRTLHAAAADDGSRRTLVDAADRLLRTLKCA